MIEHKLLIYFNPKYNGFHVVHEEKDDNIILGGCCRFLDDAYTNIMRYEIPKTYLDELIKIDLKKMDKYEFVQYGSKYQSNVYLISESLKDETYLFYNDPIILSSHYDDSWKGCYKF